MVCLSMAQENQRLVTFAIYKKERKAMSWLNFCLETDDVTKTYDTIAVDTTLLLHKQFSLSSLFSLPSSTSSFCFIHLVNRYLLSTCQVSGPVGNRNKRRKKTDESLPWRSWHSSGGLWCSLVSAMRGKIGGALEYLGGAITQIWGVRVRRPEHE